VGEMERTGGEGLEVGALVYGLLEEVHDHFVRPWNG
jgi:hypothetical protein